MPKILTPPPPATGSISNRAELGRIVRHVRLRAGLTVDEASLAIGVAKATLLRAEQGKGGLQFDNVLKILECLGVSLYALPTTHGADGGMAWPKDQA